MLHIKLKGIEHRAPWKQKCYNNTHQRPLGWGQKVIFYKSGHVAYQIKVEEVKIYMQYNTLNLHTPFTPGVRLKGQILKLCRCKTIFFIKLSTKTYLTGICYDLNDAKDVCQV